ncbi:MAG: hypothetical protein H6R15_994 [Proteobacteria bacterium]|nr:hypothetical protein [Pseudomonadota bacterium]
MKAAKNRVGWAGVGLMLALVAGMALAQTEVGQVEFAKGLTTAQQKGTAARFVVRGDALFEGDLVTTTEAGYAVLAFVDGTKITLRPATSFAIDKYAHDKGEESAFLRLVKGGMRSVTGLIGKRNPGGVHVSTVTATIGIRGTSFDARLCGSDCRQEQRENRPHPGQGASVPPADTVIGRVVQLSGEVLAAQSGKAPRRLVEGAPLLVGDEITTGRQASAVIGFRDQSRVSLEPQTIFSVDSFSFGRPERSDNVAVRLLKGGLRMFTGMIGKKNPAAVSVSTVVATIGIRGTGLDISCEGPCAAVTQPLGDFCGAAQGGAKRGEPGCADGMFVHTWNGKIFVASGGGELDVDLGRVGFAGAGKQARLLNGIPSFMNAFRSPRPDGVDVDWPALFGGSAGSGEDGLYALVRDGFIFLEAGGGRIDLGPGEGGVVGADGKPKRLEPVPSFLADDPFPAPETFNVNDPVIQQMFGATMGSPGQDMCEIQ